MKAFLTLILSLSCALAFGQVDTGFTNKDSAKNLKVNGLKEGKWVEYFKISDKMEVQTPSTDAPIYRLSVYQKGTPAGIVREYYKSGKLKSIAPYSNGDVNGVETEYAEDGKLAVIDTLVNGQGSGLIRTYYGNGKIKMEYPFAKDRMMVESKLYVPGLIDCVFGAINGIIKTYYENGKIKEETICVEGKNGLTKRFDENGNQIK